MKHTNLISYIATFIIVAMLVIFGVLSYREDPTYEDGYRAGFQAACEQYEHPVYIGYPLE